MRGPGPWAGGGPQGGLTGPGIPVGARRASRLFSPFISSGFLNSLAVFSCSFFAPVFRS